MILKSIKLENIRSYLSQHIEFPEGSLLLSGDIGSGKSTILHAVEYALFGTRRDDLTGEALLRHGKDSGSVELKFAVDNKEIIIKRMLKRSKDSIKQESGYMIIDGIKDDLMPVEIKTRILELVGYPKNLLTKSKELIYRYTVYTPQEQMKQILNEDAETRLNILRKVFGIDKYKTIKENISIYTSWLKDRSKEMAGMIVGIEEKKLKRDEYAKESERLGMEMVSLAPEIIRSQAELKKIKEEISGFESEINMLNDKKRRFEIEKMRLSEKTSSAEKNRKSINDLQNQLLMLDKNIAILQISTGITKEQMEKSVMEKDGKIKEIIRYRAEADEKKISYAKMIDDLAKEIHEKTQQISALRQKEEELEKNKIAAGRKDELAAEIEHIEKEVNELNMKIRECQLMISSSESTKSKITAIDECPTCRQKVGDAHKKEIHEAEERKIAESRQKIGLFDTDKKEKLLRHLDLKKEHEDMHKRSMIAERLMSEIRYLNRIKAEISAKDEKKLLLEEQIRQMDKKSDELASIDINSLSAGLENERSILKKILEKEYMQRAIEEKKRMLAQLEESNKNAGDEISGIEIQMARLEKDISSAKDLEEQYKKSRLRLENAAENEKNLKMKEAGMKKEAEGIGKLLRLVQQEIEYKEQIRKNIEKTLQLQHWFEDHFTNVVSQIEKQVMAKVYIQFNELFRKWFNMLVNDSMISARLDSDFTPCIEQNGYQTAADNLSGGEKTAVALAYRLALNKVINDVVSEIKTKDLIILDEPTDGFSTEQLDKVREVLDELGMKQVIIVSHESKMESFVDKIVRLNKEGHVSKMTVG